MKNFKHLLFATFALVSCFVFGACQTEPNVDNPKNKVSVTVENVTPFGATINVVTTGISEFAYLAEDSNLPAVAILMGNDVTKIDNPELSTTTTIEIDGLSTFQDCVYTFAFRNSDNTIYKDVIKVSFTTTGYTDVLTVTERKHDGFYIFVDVPDEVKERGNALRYATSSLPMFNYVRSTYGTYSFNSLLSNAGPYMTDDTLVRYDEYYSYERDEDGNIVEGGAEYADPKVPGEPGIFMIGEFSYMDDEDEVTVYYDPDGTNDDDQDGTPDLDGEIITFSGNSFTVADPQKSVLWVLWYYPAGWDHGYYRPLYDWERFVKEEGTPNFNDENYWTGYYERIQVNTEEPEILDGNVAIEIFDKSPIDACVAFTPSDDVLFYVVFICEESEWQVNYLPLIDNNEEYARWFVGSYFAARTIGTQIVPGGNAELWLSDWFVNMNGMAGKEIRVCVAGMGDNNGLTQCYNTMTFTLPTVTKPAPEVVVTPVPSNDPYNATFNIKCLSGDANEVYIACDYTREFNNALAGSSYMALMQSLSEYNMLGKNETEQVNSAEGLNVTFASREDATTRLAVLVYNDEGTSNNLNVSGSTGIAEYTTPRANYPVRVESDLFDVLCGEWTATAPMKSYIIDTDAEGNQTGAHWEDRGNYTSDVTISAGVEYPEVLPDEVYELYASAGFDRAATDALYDEFKELAVNYNNRTRGFNRLLCMGYNFADPAYYLNVIASPYDLFTAEDYSASQVSYMFYDFGPKWNLEIDEDGNVWMPINNSLEYPLEAFNFGLEYTLYIVAASEKDYFGSPIYDAKGNIVMDPRFPVEVSADGNTLTIKPIQYTDAETKEVKTYYPCVSQLSMGYATPLNPRVAGDVVLTRKGASTFAAPANARVASTEAPMLESVDGASVELAQRPRSLTGVENIEVVDYERIVPAEKKDRGYDAFSRKADALFESIYGVSLR